MTGNPGKLYIVTHRGPRFVVGTTMEVRSELRRQLTVLFS
jgi:hypothetical protein